MRNNKKRTTSGDGYALKQFAELVGGSKRDFELEGDSIRVRPRRPIPRSRTEDGYGLLRCEWPGERRLADFDVANSPPPAPLFCNLREELDIAPKAHLAGALSDLPMDLRENLDTEFQPQAKLGHWANIEGDRESLVSAAVDLDGVL
ncbi:hypothetical protein [Lamprobacter modestohalophilus]|uniref:hypothetical protein n=1 Tax=Lamprobacter modestohalophilus TaxID=1064514 RepID=UPI001F5BF645|nr:hypothetical protein [Lamprobacter modestohalophilus]